MYSNRLHFCNGLLIFCINICRSIYLFLPFPPQEGRAVFCRLRPGESLSPAHICIPIPRISPKNFIRTFAGQCHRADLSDLAAEQQQRSIHICHARQVARFHCLKQRLYQLRRINDNQMIFRTDSVIHFGNKCIVTVGLEVRFLKIFIIITIGDRNGMQLLPCCGIGARSNRRNNTRIQTTG